VHERQPASLARCWAFVIAAVILYIPANLLPVLNTASIQASHSDTIYSGIRRLWDTGSWVLAIIVFVASIIVPAAKLGSLSYLLLTVQRADRRRALARARLFRITHWIGRWSMVDIYVGATMVAVVQFKAIASITPGPGAIAFGAVVVLTMLASQSLDPRLIWDPLHDRGNAHA
jgi:paraquat-inducible protein A